jgi:hypothetical protein
MSSDYLRIEMGKALHGIVYWSNGPRRTSNTACSLMAARSEPMKHWQLASQRFPPTNPYSS